MTPLRIPLALIFILAFLPSLSKASVPYRIKSGDTLYSLLKKHKFNEQQVRIILSKSPLPKSYSLIPGEIYRTATTVDQQVELKLFSRQGNTSFTFWRKGKDQAGFKKVKEVYEIKPTTVSGQIKGSIVGSITDKVKDKLIAYRFLDAYVLDYNLKRILKRGARFSITFEKLYQNNQFIKTGEVLKTSIEINEKMVHRKLVVHAGGASFVDPEDQQRLRGFYSPVDYMSISSVFQKRRYHPIKRRRQAHLGVDFALPTGSPVYSTYPGRVIKRGRSRGAGRYVAIRHPNGLESFYNHLSAIRKDLKVGQYVSNGEQIGAIGCSGYCTKPHLHFAIKKMGRFVNPLKYIKSYPFNGKEAAEKVLGLHTIPGKKFSRRSSERIR